MKLTIKASKADISTALRLRVKVFANDIDLDILNQEQYFFGLYSKLIAESILEASFDDQKLFISQCAKILM